MAPKKTRKNHRDLTTLLVSKELEDEVARAADWPSIVEVLCHHFKIPDLSTKRGLVECRKDIDKFAQILNTAYDQGASNLRILGGVVGIYSKLVSDPTFREKLANQKLFLRISYLLKNEETCLLALRAMDNVSKSVTKSATISVSIDTAEEIASRVLTILRERPSDQSVYQSGVVILAHMVPFYSDDKPPSSRFRSIKKDEIFQAVCHAFASAQFDRTVFEHVYEILLAASLYSYLDLEQNQPALDFVVASLRVSDLKMRSMAFSRLRSLHSHHHVEEHPLAPMISSNTIQGFPPHLKVILHLYGFERSHSINMLKAHKIAHKAMRKAAATADFFELGLTLVELIPMTGNAIDVGWFKSTGPITLPFESTIEAYGLAAKALRDRDPVKYADMADILEVKFCININDYAAAKLICELAIRRSKHPYWYFALTRANPGSYEAKLRWAKRGLRCESASSGLYFDLLASACMSAADLAVKRLDAESNSLDTWYSALALLRISLKDSLEYLKNAPPDSTKMSDTRLAGRYLRRIEVSDVSCVCIILFTILCPILCPTIAMTI